MTEIASLWLLAAPDDEEMLGGVVQALAARHGAPRFQPHLTLLGDVPLPPAALVGACRRIARAAPSFAGVIADIVTGDAYFRSFYATFGAMAPLVALRAAAEASIGPAPGAFLPHVSLLYGTVGEPEKTASAAEIRTALKGRPIHFDRLALTNSANDRPIDQWRAVATFPLGES